MKGIFIVGTDTDAGKTIVGTALGVWLISKGLPLKVVKPFETGCIKVKKRLMPLDGSFYKLLLGLDEPVEDIVPFRFSQPLAPYQTSLIDEKPIKYAEALSLISRKLDDPVFYLLEGAGGLFVPLEKKIFLSELVRDLGLPVLVVAANKLGAINHTLLTLEALKGWGINNLGVILSEKEKERTLVKRLNKEYFRDILGDVYLGELPFLPMIKKLTQLWPEMIKYERRPDQVGRMRGYLGRAFEQHVASDKLWAQIACSWSP